MASTKFAHASRKSLAMGPSVRILLSHYQLDPAQITSTGPHHTLLKHDVISYVDQNKLKPKTASQQQKSKSGQTTSTGSIKEGIYTTDLDTSGYTAPKTGPEGFSKIAKELLDG